MKIRVVDLRTVNGGTPLRAYVGIKVDDMVISDWRIIQQPGQRAWVSYPQITWKDAGGKVRYKSLISIPGELKQKIDIAILSAWEEEKENELKPK
jgi:DNA-binding cell septation regulator SpoVG